MQIFVLTWTGKQNGKIKDDDDILALLRPNFDEAAFFNNNITHLLKQNNSNQNHDFDNHYLIYFVFQSLFLWSGRVAVFRISDNIANIESKLRTFRIQNI